MNIKENSNIFSPIRKSYHREDTSMACANCLQVALIISYGYQTATLISSTKAWLRSILS